VYSPNGSIYSANFAPYDYDMMVLNFVAEGLLEYKICSWPQVPFECSFLQKT
jgi:hypothetical protein